MSLTQEQIKKHNELFDKAAEALAPFVDDRRPRNNKSRDIARIKQGADIMAQVLKIHPENWSALWILGVSCATVAQWNRAYECLKRSFEINQTNPDIARELSIVCSQVERFDEAFSVALHAMALDPSDAGLVSNYAYMLFLNGDVERASQEIARSLQMAPNDPVSRHVAARIRIKRT